jgi:hypothetical protein
LDAQIIDRYVGVGGPGGYSGDGGSALAAKISYPYRMTCDKAGNLYMAEMANAVIRKISKTGIISTVAGNGTSGYSGDGGYATSAQLNQPVAVVIDDQSNMYILDYNSSVIRKVNTAGIITTIAGNGAYGYSGDGGHATLAQLNRPVDMALDIYGNIYVSDRSNNVVRKINSLGIISTIAGDGTAGYSGDNGPATSAKITNPCGLAIDKYGNIFIADNYNSVIRKVTPSGIISTFAGDATHGFGGDGGAATSAQFALGSPDGLAVDNAGNVYACDYQNHTIRKINAVGMITTVAGITQDAGISGNGGPATSAKLWFPIGITFDSCNNLFITDTYNNMIRKVTYVQGATVEVQPVDTTICEQASVDFTTHTTNTTTWQWMVNTGTGWNDLSDNSIYNGSLTGKLMLTSAGISMNNYKYRCLVANMCGSSFSDAATLTVTPSISPTIIITATATSICSGSPVTFTASPSNSGNSPFYQWKKNGLNTGLNSRSYTASNLAIWDLVSCTVTSNNTCAISTANSNVIEMKVDSTLTPSIAITSSSTSICENKSATFTASIINGGILPVYEWKKNGNNAGTNSNVYADNNILNGDIIACVLTSNINCAAASSASSNAITITVNKNPVVALNPITTLCAGSTINLSAGNFSSYLWNDGSTGSTISINSIGIYYVTVTDNYGCKATYTTMIKSLLAKPGNFLQSDTAICPNSSLVLQSYRVFKTYRWNMGATGSSVTINNPGL